MKGRSSSCKRRLGVVLVVSSLLAFSDMGLPCCEGAEPPDPESGGPSCTPGGKHCHGGSNEGNPCLTDPDCPDGTCWDDCWDDWAGASCIVYDDDTGAARCYVPKNRYLTIDPTVNTGVVAYHISLDTEDDLDDQYAECGVLEGFLSDPVCREADFGCTVDPAPNAECQGTYMNDEDPPVERQLFGWVSYVVPGPVTPRVWTEYPLLVTGCEVVPAASYHMRASADGITPLDQTPLMIMTVHNPQGFREWGDVTGGSGTVVPWLPPDGCVNFVDIIAVDLTFSGLSGPALEWADLVSDHVVNGSDIFRLVDAFEGMTYPELTDWIGGCGAEPVRPLIGHEPCDCPSAFRFSDRGAVDVRPSNDGRPFADNSYRSNVDGNPGQQNDELSHVALTSTRVPQVQPPGPEPDHRRPCGQSAAHPAHDGCGSEYEYPYHDGVDFVKTCSHDGLPCTSVDDCVPGNGQPASRLHSGKLAVQNRQGPVIEWVPVSATGPHDPIVGNDIVLHSADQEVTLEMRVSGWGDAVGSPVLGGYQGIVDSSGYTSGAGAPLSPLGGCCPGDPAGGFVDTGHPDWVFGNLWPPGVPIAVRETLDYELGGFVFSGGGVADDGETHYGGTLILQVPQGAAGLYTIDLVSGQCGSIMYAADLRTLLPVTLVPATVQVGEIDCQPNGIPDECDLDCTAQEGACNVPGCGESEDCTGNGIPDECEATPDCNGNGTADFNDICTYVSPDCNDNDIPDECDIEDGTLCDVDDDGVPDLCEALCAECRLFGPQGVDVAATQADFKIIMLGTGEERQFTGLDDPGTVFGRTDPHFEGDNPEDVVGAAVDNSGYPNTSPLAPNPCAIPSAFPQDPDLGQEIHIEVLSLELSDGAGVYARAGQAFYDSVSAAGHPELYRDSFGEAQGECIDLPADCFFNLALEVDFGDRTPKLYNKTPIVIRANDIPTFPPPAGAPEGAFLYDPDFPAVSLFDADGIHRAYLVSINFGTGGPSELPPTSCETQPGIEEKLSFAVDGSSVGVVIGTPNGVRDDWGFCQAVPELCPLPVTVYLSSGQPAGTGPDTTNEQDPVLRGEVGGSGEFKDGDAINSLSFGRDGTINLFSKVQSPTLFFSVDEVSVGEHCTDAWYEGQIGRDQAEADIYTSMMPQQFGGYVSEASPVCSFERKNCLVTDQSTLGLAPAATESNRDNMTALEVSTLADNAWAYATFTSGGTSTAFIGEEATVFVYDPASGAFEPESFMVTGVYATAADVGLQEDDVIDALAVSDITPGGKVCAGDGAPCEEDIDCVGHGTPVRCVNTPDGVWNAGDEMLMSLAPGSPTLVDLEYSAADILHVAHGESLTRRLAASDLGLETTDNVDALDVSPGFGRKDCNYNGIHDQCDIDRGDSFDDNDSGIPDECEDRNRYISFSPNNALLVPDPPGQQVALQVELTASLYFDGSIGETWWVDVPEQVTWGAPPVTEYTARLRPDPLFREWAEPFIHVGDCQIVPAAKYEVRSSLDGTALSDPPLEIFTVAKPAPSWWADTVGAVDEETWTRSDGVVNFDDIQSTIILFEGRENAPLAVAADVSVEVPDRVINMTDVQMIVLAFEGGEYPYGAPADCP